jgi:hypothetical protein
MEDDNKPFEDLLGANGLFIESIRLWFVILFGFLSLFLHILAIYIMYKYYKKIHFEIIAIFIGIIEVTQFTFPNSSLLFPRFCV